MKRVRFDAAGLALDLLEAPHSSTAWDVGGALSQTVWLTDQDVVRIVVRAGEGESLASLRRDHPDDTAHPLAATRTCGVRARRLRIDEPEEFIECIEYADGRPSSPGYFPATTTIGQSFSHGDVQVLATWDISTQLRERYRAQERRFFASLACDPS